MMLSGTMAQLFFCLAFLYISVQVSAQKSTVTIEPVGPLVVKEGDPANILCNVGVPIKSCNIKIGNDKDILFDRDMTPRTDGLKYKGAGLTTGQCGVHIPMVEKSYDGKFICKLFSVDGNANENSLMIVVATPPDTPEVSVSQGMTGTGSHKTGEKINITCSVLGGKPPANLTLYIGDELIPNDRTIYGQNADGKSLSTLSVSRNLEWTDNGKKLRCLANNIALTRPKEVGTDLEVLYAPREQEKNPIEVFGCEIGKSVQVNVTVRANPDPEFTWIIKDERLSPGRSLRGDKRIEALQSKTLGNKTWEVSLIINDVRENDTENKYTLEARNDLGTTTYDVQISTKDVPPGIELDAGSIIGIVVGALLLLLIVCLVVFARATGRWCFAGSASSRNVGESDLADPAASVSLLRFHKPKTADSNDLRSDTESAGKYSRSEVDSNQSSRPRRPRMVFSQLFKRNKDKVSGADTDTINTVVIDDKVQNSELPIYANASPSAEEGTIVYAELDLTRQEDVPASVIVENNSTEYAQIIHKKPKQKKPASNE